MSDILNKTIVLVLNRNWQAINIRTPQDAFCMLATNVATALDIELGDDAGAEALRPVTWDEWITLPVREGANAMALLTCVIVKPTETDGSDAGWAFVKRARRLPTLETQLLEWFRLLGDYGEHLDVPYQDTCDLQRSGFKLYARSGYWLHGTRPLWGLTLARLEIPPQFRGRGWFRNYRDHVPLHAARRACAGARAKQGTRLGAVIKASLPLLQWEELCSVGCQIAWWI